MTWKGAQETGAKERRDRGGGSRPWKGRGEGEARVECLHFRGEAPESLPGPGLRRRRGGKGGGRRRAGGPGSGADGLPEALLPRRVPQLQLDPLARLDLQQAGEEVHADGGVAGGGAQPREAALGEAVQEARLAHRGVSDHDEAELVDPNGLHRGGPRALRGRPTLPTAARQVRRRELSLQHLRVPARRLPAHSCGRGRRLDPALSGGGGGAAGPGRGGGGGGAGPRRGGARAGRPGSRPVLGKSLSRSAHWAPMGKWVW